jgi:hypothetical protein
MKTPAQHVSVRLDDATIARLDARRPPLSMPGRDATRSDVLRHAILLGLDYFERDPEGAKRELARLHKRKPMPE